MSLEERVPTARILVYSFPLLGVISSTMLVGFYLLKFATDILLLSPLLIGSILLGARVWDALTDPLTGWLSDRTQTRFGRRRPWFYGSAIPFAASLVMLWSPPSSLGENALSIWFGVSVLLFYTAYTTFRVPHMALGAELSAGYHDRTRVFGIAQAFECTGMLAAAGVLIFLERAEDPRMFARWLAIGIGVFSAASMLWAARGLRERTSSLGRGGGTPWQAFADVARNPHSRILLFVFLLEQLGFSGLVALFPYLSDYVLLTPGDTGLYLLGAVGSAFASIPVWVAASRRYGKQQVWLWSVIAKLVTFASVVAVGPGDGTLFLFFTMGFGFLHGCGAVVGPSLKADVVDWDEAHTGERKEGAYFAAWNFAQKFAGGLAIYFVGLMLSLTGFVPNIEQSTEVTTGIRWLGGGFPFVLHLVAAVLIARFSLGEEEHRATRRATHATQSDADPRYSHQSTHDSD